MIDFSVNTSKKKEVVDITQQINSLVGDNGVGEGICSIFVLHTTCALTTADLDPGTDLDYLYAIENIFPKGKYRHPHNPSHVGDHIMSSIIGNSVSIPINNGRLSLGTCQRVVLIELNGPKRRNLKISTTES